jgi:hypothetical protein
MAAKAQRMKAGVSRTCARTSEMTDAMWWSMVNARISSSISRVSSMSLSAVGWFLVTTAMASGRGLPGAICAAAARTVAWWRSSSRSPAASMSTRGKSTISPLASMALKNAAPMAKSSLALDSCVRRNATWASMASAAALAAPARSAASATLTLAFAKSTTSVR